MDTKSLNQAKKELAERRDIALERLENAKTLCRQNAEYAEIERRQKLNILALSKALQEGKDTAEFDKIDKALDAKLRNLECKIIGDSNVYHCSKCKDTGVINGKYCDCLIAEYKRILREKSGVNELPTFTFADSNISRIDCKQSAKLSKLYDSMQKYCDAFPNNSVKNILLSGKVGVGKSCLLSATLNAILERGVQAQYLTAFQLSNIFLSYHTTDIRERGYLLENLIGTDLLIIDDLGTEPVIKNVTIEYLTSLLNERARKHTIIATNLSLAELQTRYGDRVFSRLTNKDTTRLLYLDGDDLRHLNKQQ